MTIDQYLAWVSEQLPKDIPSEIVRKSLFFDREQFRFAGISDSKSTIHME